ncbi:MAG TPA: hypothetical protein VFM31_12365 [Nitrososphaeraceae archaeon]|nr:hypothetical protein [Nitrososphaeraceae archaeon]
MFQHHDEHEFKKIIDEFILSSSNNKSIKYLLKNIDFKAASLGISFYQMMFILIQIDAIHTKMTNDKIKLFN